MPGDVVLEDRRRLPIERRLDSREVAQPPDIVEDGVSGLLYEPGDRDAAADAVVRIIDDRDYAERLGAAARARVADRFTLARQLDETRRLVSEAAG